jgi:8-oxo-dGTP pyrophosphatase MutT (NUDIX family)
MEVVSNGDELLDVLDGDGNFTGRKPRSLVHRDHDRHGLVFVWSAWVRGGRGVMVLQRRGRSGDPYAAHIDALAGGHIGAGETPVEAALRELEEEAGVAASAHDFVRLGSSRMDRPTGDCRKVVQHLLLYPLPLELARLRFNDEVDGFVEVDLDEFSSLVLGERASIRALARVAGGDGIAQTQLPRSAVGGYPDAILDTFRRSLASIQGWLREGRVDPAHFASG